MFVVVLPPASEWGEKRKRDAREKCLRSPRRMTVENHQFRVSVRFRFVLQHLVADVVSPPPRKSRGSYSADRLLIVPYRGVGNVWKMLPL